MDLFKLALGSVVRHVLSVGSGYLISIGVSQQAASSFIDVNEPIIIGIALYASSQLWSFLQKSKTIK